MEEARPRVVLLENVEGLAYSGKDDGLRMLLAGFEAINRRTKSAYRPMAAVLNAASYGVPQLRERVFLIAACDGTVFGSQRPRTDQTNTIARLCWMPSLSTRTGPLGMQSGT